MITLAFVYSLFLKKDCLLLPQAEVNNSRSEKEVATHPQDNGYHTYKTKLFKTLERLKIYRKGG